MRREDRNALIIIAVVLAMCVGIVLYAYNKGEQIKDSHQVVSLVVVSSPEPDPRPTPTFPKRASRTRMAEPHASPHAVRVKPVAHKATGFSALELRIAWCESKNDYTAENPSSTASGRWQVVDGTWGTYGGYHHASDAPPWVQDRWARAYFDKNGYGAWRASRHCWA